MQLNAARAHASIELQLVSSTDIQQMPIYLSSKHMLGVHFYLTASSIVG